mmetsp:Transcript_22487/g.52445  ORF Transcript_22487/g.52445 Transcript_22487/m.52445 type:complete len:283 (+) Transcript_22487:50-898(+)
MQRRLQRWLPTIFFVAAFVLFFGGVCLHPVVRKYLRGRKSLVVYDTARHENGVLVETISDSPRIQVFHKLLTRTECDHIISLGKAKGLKTARVSTTGDQDADHIYNEARTNTASWLDYAQDEIVQKLEQRLADLTDTEPDNGEAFQVLKYSPGQKFDPHFDMDDPDEDPPEAFALGGNRLVTVLVYLRKPVEGGETSFPKLGLSVVGDAGDAVAFWNLQDDGLPDWRTLHAGLPPIQGEKWVATKWIHQGSYQGPLKEAIKANLLRLGEPSDNVGADSPPIK